jgi:hypothetical protein
MLTRSSSTLNRFAQILEYRLAHCRESTPTPGTDRQNDLIFGYFARSVMLALYDSMSEEMAATPLVGLQREARVPRAETCRTL